MRFTLVISGEVQVDIRLFVSLESKESLKWNVKSVFDQLLSTDRTVLIRHIVSTATHIFFSLLPNQNHYSDNCCNSNVEPED